MLVTRDARGRWGAPRTLLELGILGVWSPQGHSVLIATGVVGAPSRAGGRPRRYAGGEPRVVLAVRDPATDVAPAGFSGWAWSADGRTIYFAGRDPRDRSVAIWRLPAAGGVPRPVMRFDDPNHRWPRPPASGSAGDRFYFNLGDQQSDLWMAEIAGTMSALRLLLLCGFAAGLGAACSDGARFRPRWTRGAPRINRTASSSRTACGSPRSSSPASTRSPRSAITTR